MALSRTKSNAQLARDNYRAARIKQWAASRQAETLIPPIFPLDSIVDVADGTLNKDVLSAALSIGFSAWTALPPGPNNISTIELRWADALGDGSAPPLPVNDTDTTVYRQIALNDDVKGPLTPNDFPIYLDIPAATLAVNGKFYLLLVMQPYNGGRFSFSDPVPVTCDSVAPNEGNKPLALTARPPGPITDDYLNANGGQVRGDIPQYADFQVGDKVSFFWTENPVADDWTGETPIGEMPVTATWPFPVVYPEADLIGRADGTWYLMYGLVDKATNRSVVSTQTSVILALGALPSGMVAPIVPLAISPDTLDLKDAVVGVTVQIDDFQNHKPTDQIVVTWGATELTGKPVSANPTFPLYIDVPPDVLKNTYGAGTGQVDTPVSYVVDRGGLKSAELSTSVKVDFSVVGPPNPGIWPDPVNTDLPLAQVFGAKSLTANVLTRADENEDASIRVFLYRNLKPGEFMDFYWKGVLVPSAQYQIKGTDTDTTEIAVTIPWDVIREGFNDPLLPVHYRISAAAGFDDNEQHSPNTLVAADAVTPVGPDPEFLGGNVGGGGVVYLNCDSLWDSPVSPDDPAIRVEVPDLTQAPLFLPDGTVIKMKWRVVDDIDPSVPIPEVDFDEEITLGVDYPRTGFIWRVPYADYIEPIYALSQDGIAQVSYSFMFGAEEVFSGQIEGNVAMHTGVAQCPLTPPPRKNN